MAGGTFNTDAVHSGLKRMPIHLVWGQSRGIVHGADELIPLAAVSEALGADILRPGPLSALVTHPGNN